ncbi:MAG: RNA polymerase sigma factor [Fibrobacterota bacterium]
MTEALLEKCRKGDEKAFAVLFREYGSLINSVAYRVVRNSYETEEVVQKVFEKIIRNIKSFRGTSSLSTWIYKISFNTALNHLASGRNYRGNVSYEDVKESYSSNSWESPEKSAEKKEIMAKITEIISNMPSEQKEAISFFYFGEMSILEICEKTGRSKSAVKTALSRGRKAIASELGTL